MSSIGDTGPTSTAGKNLNKAINIANNIITNVTNGGGRMKPMIEAGHIMSDLGLPAAGKGAYFGTMEAHKATIGSARAAGGLAGAGIAGSAALDYFTGMDMPDVQSRAFIGKKLGEKGISDAAKADLKGLRSDIGKMNPWNRGRVARAGARVGAAGLALSAVSYLNPFSFGD